MNGVLQWNVKTVVIAVGVSVSAIYLLYSLYSGTATSSSPQSLKTFDSWKVKEFVDIPEPILQGMKNVKIDEHHLSVKMGDETVEIYSRQVTPSEPSSNPIPVLLLHGMAFSSANWEETQTLQLLATLGHRAVAVDLPDIHNIEFKLFLATFRHQVNLEVYFREYYPRPGNHDTVLLLHGAGDSSEVWLKTQTLVLLAAMDYRVVALDLPGWGKSKGAKLNEEQKGEFLKTFIEMENLDRPVIVSPSMSGSFAIPYLMTGKPFTCQERARGFIPLAPVGTEAFTHANYHKCEIPTMIVYGTKDKSLGLTSLNSLRNMANREIFPMENGGHPCYIERPEEWRRLLYNYMLAIQLFKV